MTQQDTEDFAVLLGPKHIVHCSASSTQREAFDKYLSVLIVYTFAGVRPSTRQENKLFKIFLEIQRGPIRIHAAGSLPSSVWPEAPKETHARVVGLS